MKKFLCVTFTVVSIVICHANVKLGMLSENDGQRMVRAEFLRCSFEKGSFGNDVSLLLPFCWTIPERGTYTYFSAAEQMYSDGIFWEMKQIKDGKLLLCDYPFNSASDVWFRPFELFEIKFEDGATGLAYHNDRYRNVDEYISSVDVKWYNLSVCTNGVPLKTLMDNGIVSLFTNEHVRVIRNLVPHRYRGAKADIVKEPTLEQKRLMESTARWELPDVDKKQLTNIHCKYVESIKGSGIVSNVYVIACDANFDGSIDAYVSSDAEKGKGKIHKWTLYVKERNGLFARPEKTQLFSFDRIEKHCIDSELYVSQDAFFMIDRIGVSPYVMAIILDNGKPEFWSYAKHESVVRSFRKKCGMENADFLSCIGVKVNEKSKGIASLRDVFLIHSMLVSAKRLQCEAIVVPQAKSRVDTVHGK